MKKILLIEDEADIRTLYAGYLRDNGYEVIEAQDGIVGYTKAVEEDWDVMLLDIMLPGQDGIALLKKIKPEDKTANKPIIALTNLSVESVITQVFDQGADGFLIKSEITPDKIVAEVESVLQKYS